MSVLYHVPMFSGNFKANGNTYTVTNGVVDVTDEADVPNALQAGFTYEPTAAHLTQPTAAEIADAVLDEAMAGHVDAGSLGKAVADVLVDTAVLGAPAGASLAADVAAIKAETAAIVEDTGELGAAVGASLSADIAAVKAETATIVADTNEVQTDLADGGRLDLILDTINTNTAP